MTKEKIQELIDGGETLLVEFKSEKTTPFADKDIYEVLVCLANADGGVLLIGVENNKAITGARPRSLSRLQSSIFNNTEPHLSARISTASFSEGDVIAIEVDASSSICATKGGLCVRRIMGIQGPECQPFYPHEHSGRRGDFGLLDFTAQPCPGSTAPS